MRVALLSDVHANLPALEAALELLAGEGVARYVCAGDLVGYGPFPNECVARLAEIGAVCVAGNHDLIAVGRLSDRRCSSLARATLAWTRARLEPETEAFLRRLPLQCEVDGGIVVAHGSLADPEEYVLRAGQAEAELERLEAEHPRARMHVLGHTHRAIVYEQHSGALTCSPASLRDERRYLLNPGSVGQARERMARVRFLVLDLQRQQAMPHAIPYDVDLCRATLRLYGLPASACHLRPDVTRSLARRLRASIAPESRHGAASPLGKPPREE